MTPPPSGLRNAAGSPRQELAAASSICQVSSTRCQARTRLYRDGALELEGFPVADISDHLSDGSVAIWLDLRDPDRDDLVVLSEEFGLHRHRHFSGRVRWSMRRLCSSVVSPGRTGSTRRSA